MVSWIGETYLVLRGAERTALRGRGRSGFTSAGYHEASYCYGGAVAAAELEGLADPAILPTFLEVKRAALADAQAELVEVVRAGDDPFAPVERRGAA